MEIKRDCSAFPANCVVGTDVCNPNGSCIPGGYGLSTHRLISLRKISAVSPGFYIINSTGMPCKYARPFLFSSTVIRRDVAKVHLRRDTSLLQCAFCCDLEVAPTHSLMHYAINDFRRPALSSIILTFRSGIPDR